VRTAHRVMDTRNRRLATLNDFVSRHAEDVTYVRQRFQWDCGLACAEMALHARGVRDGATIDDLRLLCNTDSVWTIDLAYLLSRFGVNIRFSTLTRGARAEYGEQPFYRKQFPEDAKRVTELFRQSSERGVNVQQRSVDLVEIIRAVQADNMLILVLLDKRLLSCPLCDQRAPSRPESPGFLGHYVMLYAYDAQVDSFLMKDPASLRDACVISSSTLEAARSAFGTDEDIIFIGSR
jgi:Guanylylate cyclase